MSARPRIDQDQHLLCIGYAVHRVPDFINRNAFKVVRPKDAEMAEEIYAGLPTADAPTGSYMTTVGTVTRQGVEAIGADSCECQQSHCANSNRPCKHRRLIDSLLLWVMGIRRSKPGFKGAYLAFA